MSDVTRYRMTKKDFENFLWGLNFKEPIGHRITTEDFENPTKIHLYYTTEGKHFGTWHQGVCWIFNSVVYELRSKENVMRKQGELSHV
jgi:hypothetical protein